jgi:hypothetical protein
MASPQEILIAKDNATQKYEGARHLLQVTFPMIKDPKLLLGVMDNISASLESSMDAILAYERLLRLVPIYNNNYQSKFNLFRMKSVKRNNISPEVIHLMSELRYTLDLHKKSPMEFQRGNRFVICNKDYQLKVISLKDLQQYIYTAKGMLDQMEKIVSKYL